ncbi:MAG: DUF481 domain-containing protein [Bacteroidota bacterium]
MKRVLYFFFLLAPFVLPAQTNESDTLDFQTLLSLTGFYQAGNVETLIFRAKSDVTYKPWRKWVFKNKNSYVYQEFGREKADEDILSLNFLYFNPERKFYPQLIGIIATNFRREINIRSLFGAGVTYQVLNKEDNWLKFSVSSEYEQTDFKQGTFNRTVYNGSNSINTFRGTLWINGKYHLFKKKVIIAHESFFQPSLERSDNFRWQADLALELPIWKYFNFKISYLHTYESIVIEGQKEQDQTLSVGVTLKNY